VNTKRQTIVLCNCCVTVSLFVSGCGLFSTPAPTFTPVPTSTPMPTLPPMPEKTPPPVRIWEGADAKTICLQTELTSPEGNQVIPDPIGEAVRNILRNMGLQVVDHGAPCDATLTITTDAGADKGFYVPGGSCYTGGNVQMAISFTAIGQEDFETVINAERPAGEVVGASWCEEHRQPDDFLEYYVFEETWSEPLLDILVDLWGPQVLVWAMDQIAAGKWPNHVSRRLETIGPTDEIVRALIYALQDESKILRRNAACMVRGFGWEAKDAFPFLPKQ